MAFEDRRTPLELELENEVNHSRRYVKLILEDSDDQLARRVALEYAREFLPELYKQHRGNV